MANRTWSGAVSSDVAVAGNWDTIPGAGDNAYFTSGTRDATGTLPNITTGSVVFTPGFAGNVGSAGTPLTLGTFASLKYAGSGTTAYFTTADASFTAQFDRGICSLAGAGVCDTLYVNDAKVSVTIATATTVYGMTPASNITVETSANALVTLKSVGTVVVNARPVTTATIVGPNGKLIAQESTAITTSNVDGGATYNKRSSGVDGTLNLFGRGSTFTPIGNPFVPVATATIGTVNLFGNGVFVPSAGGYTVVVTTSNYFGTNSGPES